MKTTYRKTALATALASALCLGAGSASALELNIYGVGHVSADNNDDGNSSQWYAASNSSRLGFKGNHGIGNGLKIVFQYESGVDLTGRGTNDGNGGGTSNNLFSTARDSFVGLSGNFGTVVGGRLAALNQWVYDYNLFADQVGDLGNIWGGSGLPGRANGTLAYLTPDLGNGFSAVVAYMPENGTKDADALVLKGNYASGPLKLGLGYINLGTGTGNPDWKTTAITASYDMGNLTVGGGYQTESDMGGINGNDRDSYTLGASFRIGGAGTIKAQYTNSNADAANSDASMYAVGYDYALTKSTTVYVAYSSTDNDPLAAFSANNWGHGQAVAPFALGSDPSSFSIGVVYKFNVGLK